MDQESAAAASHETVKQSRWTKSVALLLAASYGIGSPIVVVLEYRGALLSDRFDLPPSLIYLTSFVQIACVPFLFSSRHAAKAAALLSILTLGAVFSHLRMESPVTAIPAVLFTGLQLWFAFELRGRTSR
jgi:hypothetical protein